MRSSKAEARLEYLNFLKLVKCTFLFVHCFTEFVTDYMYEVTKELRLKLILLHILY